MVAQFFEKGDTEEIPETSTSLSLDIRSEDTEIEKEQQPETIVIQESGHVTEEKENEYVEKQPEKVTIDEENDTSALQLSMSSEASIESSETNVEVIEDEVITDELSGKNSEAQTNVETEIIASQSSPKVEEVAELVEDEKESTSEDQIATISEATEVEVEKDNVEDIEVHSTTTSTESNLPDKNVKEPEVDTQAIEVTFDFCQPKNSETPLKNIPEQDVSSEFSFTKPTLDKEDQITTISEDGEVEVEKDDMEEMEVQSTATSTESKLPDMNVNEPEVEEEKMEVQSIATSADSESNLPNIADINAPEKETSAIQVTFDFCQPENSETPMKNIPEQDVSSEFSFSKPTLDKESDHGVVEISDKKEVEVQVSDNVSNEQVKVLEAEPEAEPEAEIGLSESQEMEVGDSDSELSETEVTVALTPSSRKSMVAQLFDKEESSSKTPTTNLSQESLDTPNTNLGTIHILRKHKT